MRGSERVGGQFFELAVRFDRVFRKLALANFLDQPHMLPRGLDRDELHVPLTFAADSLLGEPSFVLHGAPAISRQSEQFRGRKNSRLQQFAFDDQARFTGAYKFCPDVIERGDLFAQTVFFEAATLAVPLKRFGQAKAEWRHEIYKFAAMRSMRSRLSETTAFDEVSCFRKSVIPERILMAASRRGLEPAA
jgi:hypothetical protein